MSLALLDHSADPTATRCAAVVEAGAAASIRHFLGGACSHAHPGPTHHSARTEVRNFGRFGDAVEVPPLTDVQTRVLRPLPATRRRRPRSAQPTGLEGVLREIFPIESYDKTLSLEYIKYELGKPRYGPDECRQLRLTYGRPFRVWLRLNKEQPVEEEVYLGDMPIMIGGGEFIINGAERVVVSQLHRSPGVDFVVETEAGDRKLHSLPHHPRARQLDRDQRHQEGHARRPHRPVGQVLGHDAAARDGPGVLQRRRHPPGVLPETETVKP